ncbi:hypothetical protein BDV95DRAFT_587339 [Massariosphaeria phaeospora]|uniref:G-patch domain-containing protein n=1 Tax=Massariosphaeria phaeospora TaxID=100035 RepID=A0A7C8I2F4_9PLEO|nr:hypothetical protein BDV95DRAFT_587339 [Massariosphaeria phaeospora]
MDTDAYLRRHGWKGTGHSLDTHGRGISKPLLIAHKQDQLGLGKKKAAHNTDDQWWMRAFDESLQNIGTGKESTLSQVRTKGINRGGLYGFFVRGEGLTGTISSAEESSAAEPAESSTSSTGTSTPPTTASESEVSDEDSSASESTAMAAGKGKGSKKRKREDDQSQAGKKQKQDGTTALIKPSEDLIDTEGPKEAVPEISKAALKQINRNVRKAVKRGEYSALVAPLPEDKKKDKQARHERTAAIRKAKRDLRKQMVVDAMMSGELPNPKNYTREEALEQYEADIKADKQQQKRAKLEKTQVKARMHEAGKLARRQTKTERRQKRLEQRAKDEQYRIANTPDQRRIARTKAQQLAAEAAANQDAVTSKLLKLTPEEKAQHVERAAMKKQTLEEYTLRRIQKKIDKNSSAPETQPKNAHPALLFVTDTAGDAALLDKAKRDLAKITARKGRTWSKAYASVLSQALSEPPTAATATAKLQPPEPAAQPQPQPQPQTDAGPWPAKPLTPKQQGELQRREARKAKKERKHAIKLRVHGERKKEKVRSRARDARDAMKARNREALLARAPRDEDEEEG